MQLVQVPDIASNSHIIVFKGWEDFGGKNQAGKFDKSMKND